MTDVGAGITAIEVSVNSMDDYRRHVQAAADEANGATTVLNRTPDHASVVLSIIFDKAELLVEIITGGLDNAVWGASAVTEAAVAFLRRDENAKLRIVSEREVLCAGNDFLTAIKDAGLMDRIKVFKAPPALVAGYKYHFIVADGKHYRFQPDRSKFEATIQFGAENIGAKLHVIFADIRARCEAAHNL